MSEALRLPDRSSHRSRVAAGVRAQIALAGLSASQAARAIGLSQPAMSRRTTGELPFDIDELGALADVLGIEIEDFLAIAPSPQSGPFTGSGAGRSLLVLPERGPYRARTDDIHGGMTPVEEHIAPVTPIRRAVA